MTTTMTETFDAQMTDSGDIDISMYSGMATTDSWLSIEASMREDDLVTDAATSYYEQQDIEIEMGDDNDEPITEYDMADEGDVYDGSEIQDVEVYDISQVASPLPVDDSNISHTVTEDTMHLPSFNGAVEPLPTIVPIEVTVETELTTTVDPTPPSPSILTTDVADHGSLPPSQQNSISAAAAPVAEKYTALVHAFADVHAPVDENPGSSDSCAGPTEVATLQDTSEQEAAVLEHEFRLGYEISARSEPPQLDHHEEDDLPRESELIFDVTNESPHGIGIEANDPHEISEGVYIDPPPPVLLSLPPCADCGECCLFNMPNMRSSQSPSSSAQPDTGDGPRLLLQDRPTLYYEPLSAVFTALRQEQCVYAMSGFDEAELVLDAYDLQLIISEDNVYTHEVTLHELNVIHDGSDLTGPLRLRLRVYTPRFATRYSMLRDQISRLNFVEDEEVYQDHSQHDQSNPAPEDQLDAEGKRHQMTEPSGEDSEEAHPPGSEVDIIAQGDQQELTDVQALEDAAVPSPKTVDKAAILRDEATGVDLPLQEKQIAAARENVEDGVDADEDASGEYEDEDPTFDADEVHAPSANEGGDYVKQTAYADDTEVFGEDLSEEFGNETIHEHHFDVSVTDRDADASDIELKVQPGEDRSVVGEHEEQYGDAGLLDNPDTDLLSELNSTDVPELESQHSTYEEVVKGIQENSKVESDGYVYTVALSAEPEDELNDNWGEVDTLSSHDDNANLLERSAALSRQSSTATLASGASKRAYEEVDLDDFDDEEDNSGLATGSPNQKRLRTE